MYNLDWSAEERLVSNLLQPTNAPARWLNQLSNAVANLQGLARAGSLLVSFWRPFPLANLDPLAVLSGVVSEPSLAPIEKGDAYAEAKSHIPATPTHRMARKSGPPFNAEPVGRASQNDLRPVGGSDSRRHRFSDLTQQAQVAGISSLLGSPDESQRSRRPLPEVLPKTLPTYQLEALISGGEGQGVKTVGQPSGTPNRSGTTGSKETEAGQVYRAPVSTAIPATTNLATHNPVVGRQPEGATRSKAGHPMISQTSFSPDLLPSQAEAGVALLARLTKERDGRGNDDSGRSSPYSQLDNVDDQVWQVAINRAFEEKVQFGTLSASQLAELAPSDLRRRLGSGSTPEGIFDSDREVSSAALAVAEEYRQETISAQPRRASPKTKVEPGTGAEPEAIALLRETLSRFSAPTKPTLPGHLAGSQAEMRRQRETLSDFSVPTKPTSPGHLAGSQAEMQRREGGDVERSSEDILGFDGETGGGPAVQNTFNITVHMEGGLAGNEDELAERLTRILVEQARRYGIDV